MKEEFNLSDREQTDVFCYAREDVKEAVRRLKEETNCLCYSCQQAMIEEIDKIFGEKLK